MKNLSICFLCQDISFAEFIRTIDEMGHTVNVSSDNIPILDLCRSDRIALYDATKKVVPDVTIVLNNTRTPPDSDYIIRLCSSEADIENNGEYLKRGTFFHWLVVDKNNSFQTIGEICITDDSTSKTIILDSLKETLSDIIISISREEPINKTSRNNNAISHPENREGPPHLATISYTDNTENALYHSFLVLLKRYFGENCRPAKSSQYLFSGRLDGIYAINDVTRDSFDFSSDPVLFLISTEPSNGNTLANPDALITVRKHQDRLELALYSNEYRFAHFLEHWIFLTQEYLCNKPVDTIDFLTDYERSNVLVNFNQATIDHKQGSIIDVFDKNVELYHDHIAIVFQGETWTYDKLARLSNVIAEHIAEFSFPPETPILVALDRTPFAVAALLGILRSGCCYVPLDHSYPRERLTAIVSDTQASLCLSQVNDRQLFDLDFEKINTLWLEQLSETPLKKDVSCLKPVPSSLAYIIYTSGSTGVPKGVMIEHGNIVNLAASEGTICNLSSSSRVLNVASFGFDAAGWDIYGALLNGGTLVIAPTTIHKLPDELHAFIQENEITFATLTPAVLTLMPAKPIDSLQTLVVMGDVCSSEIMDLWAKNCRLFNGYGPTETTIGAVMAEYTLGKENDCIGKPLHNYQVYILDPHLNPLPVGVIGEICIGGAGLARGYYNNLSSTTDRFVHHTFTKNNESIRLYRTGDLGYWNQNDNVVFIGRIDHQVKIHGVRIELREIELVLEKYAEIDQAVVMTTGIEPNKQLIAWITLKNNTVLHTQVKQAIQNHLKNFLHSAVIPRNITILDKFPINSNGKIDRKNLPQPDCHVQDQQEISNEYMFNEEKIIQVMIQELLKIPHISTKQNIFDTGIHSLIAAQIIARINDTFELALSTRDVFERPTIFELATLVQQQVQLDTVHHKIIPLSHRQGPLTAAQQQLWFLHQLNPDNTSYNLPLAIELNGIINYGVLQKALDAVIEKHESFRLVFGHTKGVPFQRALESNHVTLTPVKINRDDLAEELTKRCQLSFNLVSSPPVSITFFELSASCHVLFFVKHNLITDAWSEGLIIKDLATLYNRILAGENLVFAPLSVQMMDVANFTKAHSNKQTLQENLSYWVKKLSHYESFEFPSDFHRPMNMQGTGYRYRYHFKMIRWSDLQQVARNNNCTSFMLLVAALNVLAYKYTGKTDIVLGTALAGRTTSDIEKISGFFVNTLPLRLDFNATDNTVELLKMTRETCLEAYHHQSISFDSIVEGVKAERFINKNPLFQVMIILNNADEWAFPSFGDAQASHLLVQTMTSMFDMTWNFFETKNDLYIDIDYSTELFDHKTIEGFLQNFETLLAGFEIHSDTPIYNLPVLADKQITLLDKIEQGPTIALKHESILDALEQTVAKYGSYPALRHSEGIFTYDELWQNTCKIAIGIHLFLADTTAKRTPHVAIIMNRNGNMVKAILAVLKAGKSYIPIDPDYPEDRIQKMIEDSEASLIISEFDHDYKPVTAVTIDELYAIGEQHADTPLPAVSQKDIAYILYTSGSTGHPKGVMISHGNLVNFCQDFISRLNLTTQDKFLSITTISFDIFGLELFCTLLAGAELIIAHQDVARNPVHLVNFMIDVKPTIMQATPTMWNMIIDHIPFSDNFTILCGGEALPAHLLPKLQARCTKLLNLYGPTETTIWSTAADLTNQRSVNIGNPVSNTRCHVLDGHMTIAPIGAWGNLYISGKGLATGYWNRPELTQSVFIQDGDDTLYKTGDSVKWDHSGNLIYGGRNDFQVKLRGHRIELGEIESRLVTHADISEAVVNLADHNGDKILVGYILCKSTSSPPDNAQLRSFLDGKLPAYMIPSTFIVLDAWPLTPNNKIDRKKLPEPGNHAIAALGQYVSPSDDFEYDLQAIWQSVLNIENISVLESFFSLGGHSLHIPQIVALINEKHDMKLTIREFILNSTIRELTDFLKKTQLENACV